MFKTVRLKTLTDNVSVIQTMFVLFNNQNIDLGVTTKKIIARKI